MSSYLWWQEHPSGSSRNCLSHTTCAVQLCHCRKMQWSRRRRTKLPWRKAKSLTVSSCRQRQFQVQSVVSRVAFPEARREALVAELEPVTVGVPAAESSRLAVVSVPTFTAQQQPSLFKPQPTWPKPKN